MQSLTKDTQTHTQLMVAMMMSKSRSMSLILIYDDRVIFDRRLLDILWLGQNEENPEAMWKIPTGDPIFI